MLVESRQQLDATPRQASRAQLCEKVARSLDVARLAATAQSHARVGGGERVTKHCCSHGGCIAPHSPCAAPASLTDTAARQPPTHPATGWTLADCRQGSQRQRHELRHASSLAVLTVLSHLQCGMHAAGTSSPLGRIATIANNNNISTNQQQKSISANDLPWYDATSSGGLDHRSTVTRDTAACAAAKRCTHPQAHQHSDKELNTKQGTAPNDPGNARYPSTTAGR